MDSLSARVTARELRNELSTVVGRVTYGGERVGITRNGKLAAVMLSVDDLEALEAFEMARDVEEYRAARRDDDGVRVPLSALIAELDD